MTMSRALLVGHAVLLYCTLAARDLFFPSTFIILCAAFHLHHPFEGGENGNLQIFVVSFLTLSTSAYLLFSLTTLPKAAKKPKAD